MTKPPERWNFTAEQRRDLRKIDGVTDALIDDVHPIVEYVGFMQLNESGPALTKRRQELAAAHEAQAAAAAAFRAALLSREAKYARVHLLYRWSERGIDRENC